MVFQIEPYSGSKPFIFVSYCHKDKDEVGNDLSILNNKGVRIWFDKGITLTKSWDDEIANAINSCEFFIVFISPNSILSQTVKDEINFAYNQKKPILAIYIQKTTLSPGLELRIGMRQALLKYNFIYEDYIKKLMECITKEALEKKLIEFSINTPQINKILDDSSIKSIILLEKKCLHNLEMKFQISIPLLSCINGTKEGYCLKGGRIHSLCIKSKKIGILPKSISLLKNLSKLYLNYNNITKIPRELCNLQSLQTLSLIGNKLSSIPYAIGRLTSLKELYITRNIIDSIPDSIGQLKSLEVLAASENMIHNIPKAISKLINLKIFLLYKNQLATIPLWLGSMKSLIKVNFQKNLIPQMELKSNVGLSNLKKNGCLVEF